MKIHHNHVLSAAFSFDIIIIWQGSTVYAYILVCFNMIKDQYGSYPNHRWHDDGGTRGPVNIDTDLGKSFTVVRPSECLEGID